MVAIYLAGKIQKEHEISDDPHWSPVELDALTTSLDPLPVILLNPAIRSDDLSDQKSVFGRDMLQVYASDVVFVDARAKRGLGVGAEMLWAKQNSRPIVTLAPQNSHYRKEQTALLGVSVTGWCHPFVESLSDAIVDTVEAGAAWIKRHLETPWPIKGPSFIHEAMEHYKETQVIEKEEAWRTALAL